LIRNPFESVRSKALHERCGRELFLVEKTDDLPPEAKVLGIAPGQRCELCGSGFDVFLIRRRKGEEAAPLHKACAVRAWSKQQ
jgi:hypothetical protein